LATINIANLTFTHKGNYDGSTAYVKNDVVYYATNGNAYIAKQNTTGNAPTNGTYWSQFTAGSGGIWNAGLSLGSAGQVVKVNSGASALEFGTLSSDFVRLASLTQTSEVASFSVDGYFTSDYDIYKIFLSGATSDGNKFQVRVNHGGTAQTGSNYQYLANYVDLTTSNSANSGVNHSTNDTQFRIGWQDDTATRRLNAEITVFDPLNTNRYKAIQYHSSSFLGSYWYMVNGFSQYESTTAISGLTFKGHSNSQNVSADHIYVYGIKNA
jgi:hypothetical protein